MNYKKNSLSYKLNGNIAYRVQTTRKTALEIPSDGYLKDVKNTNQALQGIKEILEPGKK